MPDTECMGPCRICGRTCAHSEEDRRCEPCREAGFTRAPFTAEDMLSATLIGGVLFFICVFIQEILRHLP